VLLAGRELLLEFLGERLPVDVLDLAVGLLELLLDLLGDSLDIVSSDLLDLVQDALEVLVLQVGKEATDSARVGSDGGEQGEGSRREEGFGELRSGIALGSQRSSRQTVTPTHHLGSTTLSSVDSALGGHGDVGDRLDGVVNTTAERGNRSENNGRVGAVGHTSARVSGFSRKCPHSRRDDLSGDGTLED